MTEEPEHIGDRKSQHDRCASHKSLSGTLKINYQSFHDVQSFSIITSDARARCCGNNTRGDWQWMFVWLGVRCGDERKQREGGPGCGQEVNRRGE